MVFGTLKNKAKSFLGQYEQKDPATFAAAQQAIGGLLILDGLTGIDNPFEGKKRPGIFGALVGIVVGTLFMFVPSFIDSQSGLSNMTSTTNAVIVSMTPVRSSTQSSGTACSLIVRYTVTGKEYAQPSSISSSGYCGLTAGQTIPIDYNPKNPGMWAYNLKSITTFVSIFFWAGLFFVVVSIITFIIRLLSIIYGWKLLQQGRTLAKSIPEGPSLGRLVEEIKQNFTGVIFKRSATDIPASPELAFMKVLQGQALPNPLRQEAVSLSTPVSPQQVANVDNPPTQPIQASAQAVSVPSPSSSTGGLTSVNTTSSLSPQPEVDHQNDHPS
jgi:hypothetical protein